MAKAQQRNAAVKKPAKKVTAKKIAPKTAVVKPAVKTLFRQDVRQTATLVRVGRAGAANAIRASKALGLPITYMQEGAVIQELPNGVKKVLTTITDARINTPAISLKKGMIFHAKK
jgi:hypothetical protein